jgi:hypothetical protein
MKKFDKLHILSTCTNIKSQTVPDICSIEMFDGMEIAQACRNWKANLTLSGLPKVPAQSLYVGSHWKETLASVKVAQVQGFTPDLFILSAGWGLVHQAQLITPYAATFANSGGDSIHRLNWPSELSTKERCRLWWESINDQFYSMKRPLSERFSDEVDSLFLVILSKDYYQAIEQELLEMVSKGHEILILSAGLFTQRKIAHPQLKNNILPFNDKFKQMDPYLNKTNVSLNARLANWLLGTYADAVKMGVKTTVEILLDIEASLPSMVRKDVVKMTDEEVLGFIAENFVPQVSTATQLLTILREQNKSCEQKRFGGLFKQYQTQHGGGLF